MFNPSRWTKMLPAWRWAGGMLLLHNCLPRILPETENAREPKVEKTVLDEHEAKPVRNSVRMVRCKTFVGDKLLRAKVVVELFRLTKFEACLFAFIPSCPPALRRASPGQAVGATNAPQAAAAAHAPQAVGATSAPRFPSNHCAGMETVGKARAVIASAMREFAAVIADTGASVCPLLELALLYWPPGHPKSDLHDLV